MLAFLFSLVAATTYPACDAIDSCLGQVNGTLPLIKFIPTLKNGGIGFSFSTFNCLDGTLALSETCMCGTKKMDAYPSYPGYCYQGSGDNHLYKHDYAFCANQFGLTKNTFFPMNKTTHLLCHCFDPATGISDTAHIGKPMCSKGFAYYEDCELLDGADDNKAMLAPYTGEMWEAIKLLFPDENDFHNRQPACQCGTYGQCRAPTTINPHNAPYCQYLVEVCTTVKECGVSSWSPEGIFDDDGCACGDTTCTHAESCNYEEKDGKHMYVCTWNGQSAETGHIIKTSKATSGSAFVFSLLVLLCAIIACIFATVSYCRAKKL